MIAAPFAYLMVACTKDVWPSIEQPVRQWMSPSEMVRYQNLSKPLRQQEFAASRYVLRLLIAQTLKNNWQDIVLDTTDNGPPIFSAASIKQERYYLGLSHSKNWIAAIMSNFRVGIDLEVRDPHKARNINGLIEFCCSSAEKKWISKIPEIEKENYFLKLWTMKEAYFKKTATGIDLSLLKKICTLTNKQTEYTNNFHIENRRGNFDECPFELSICSNVPVKALSILNSPSSGKIIWADSTHHMITGPRMVDPRPAAHAVAS